MTYTFALSVFLMLVTPAMTALAVQGSPTTMPLAAQVNDLNCKMVRLDSGMLTLDCGAGLGFRPIAG